MYRCANFKQRYDDCIPRWRLFLSATLRPLFLKLDSVSQFPNLTPPNNTFEIEWHVAAQRSQVFPSYPGSNKIQLWEISFRLEWIQSSFSLYRGQVWQGWNSIYAWVCCQKLLVSATPIKKSRGRDGRHRMPFGGTRRPWSGKINDLFRRLHRCSDFVWLLQVMVRAWCSTLITFLELLKIFSNLGLFGDRFRGPLKSQKSALNGLPAWGKLLTAIENQCIFCRKIHLTKFCTASHLSVTGRVYVHIKKVMLAGQAEKRLERLERPSTRFAEARSATRKCLIKSTVFFLISTPYH